MNKPKTTLFKFSYILEEKNTWETEIVSTYVLDWSKEIHDILWPQIKAKTTFEGEYRIVPHEIVQVKVDDVMAD